MHSIKYNKINQWENSTLKLSSLISSKKINPSKKKTLTQPKTAKMKINQSSLNCLSKFNKPNLKLLIKYLTSKYCLNLKIKETKK